MAKITTKLPASYWEIEKKQRALSIWLFFLLFVFYILTLGFTSAAILLSLGIFIFSFSLFTVTFLYKYMSILFLISGTLTIINYFQAKKSGVRYILTNLRAYPPDPQDRYHLSLINVAEEMKISSGLTVLKIYVVPSINVNSLSLIDYDNIPAIAVTEGLLAEATRDELEAVIAQEIAHIVKGDTFLLTMVCSLASFYERLLEATEKREEDYDKDVLARNRKQGVGQPLIYLTGFLSNLLIHFFIGMISQNRELLADAASVELSRNPLALARILYKAQIANSFLGDSSFYTPIFLIPPDSKEITDTPWNKFFNTHPPMIKRIKLLADMSHREVKEVIEEVRIQEEARIKAMTELHSSEEEIPEKKELIKNLQQKTAEEQARDKIWLVRNSKGLWEGPYSLGALLTLPFFTPALKIKNIKENLQGQAKEFPQVRFALYNQLKNKPLNQLSQNRCPSCSSKLSETFYEGVPIKTCPVCSGKLVRINDLEKILSRKEFTFSEKLKNKADLFFEAMMNPKKGISVFPAKKTAPCPECGLGMTISPFSFYYIFPVEKCFHCNLIWFEADELEILQILVEKSNSYKLKNQLE